MEATQRVEELANRDRPAYHGFHKVGTLGLAADSKGSPVAIEEDRVVADIAIPGDFFGLRKERMILTRLAPTLRTEAAMRRVWRRSSRIRWARSSPVIRNRLPGSRTNPALSA